MNIPARSQLKVKRLSCQSKKFRKQRRKQSLAIGLLIVASIAIWTFVIIKVSQLPSLNIQDILVSGIDQDIAQKMKASAVTAMRGKYLGTFPKTNAWLCPQNQIAGLVKDDSFRVKDVEVKRLGLTYLSIQVKEKIPKAIVCANLPDWNESQLFLENREDCYLTDINGQIYMVATTSSVKLNRYYIPSLADATTTASNIGREILPGGEFQKFQSFYDNVKSNNIDILAMLIKDDNEYEFYFNNQSNTTVVYFNKINDLNNQLSALISFWKNVEKKAKSGQNMKFDSIDLRYGSKVYYRLSD